MIKFLSSLISKTLVVVMIFSLTFSGCSESLFIPIVEEFDENNEPDIPDGPVISTDFALTGGAGTTTEGSVIYTSATTVPLTITRADDLQEWTEIKIWTGSKSDDEPTDYTASLDFDGNSSLNYDFSLGTSTEGSYAFHVMLKNLTGEESDIFSGTIVLDTTAPAPSFNITDSTGGTLGVSTSNSTVYLRFTDVSTEINSLAGMKIWQSSEPSTYSSFSQPVTRTLSTQGQTYTFYARLKDKAGNESAVLSQSIIYDTSIPSVAIYINDEADSAETTTSRDLTVYADADFPLEGQASQWMALWYDQASAPVDADTVSFLAYASSKSLQLPSTNGDYRVRARIREGADNVSDIYTRNIRFDNVSPTLDTFTINGSSSPSPTNDGVLTFAASGSDNLADSDLEIKIWEGATEPDETDYVSIGSVLSESELTIDGTYTYHVRLRDNCGNESGVTDITIEYDATAPEITSLSCTEGTLTQSTDITLNLDVSSDVTEMKIWSDGAEPSDSSYVSYASSASHTLSSAEGTYTVSVRVRDEAGNESALATHTITYDATVPTVSFLIDGGATVTNETSVTLSVTTATDVSGIRVWETTEPSTWTSYNYGDDVSYGLNSPSNGSSHTIHMRVRDGAGNASEEYTQNISYDNAIGAPVLSIDQGTVTASEDLTLSISADSDVTDMKLWSSQESEPASFESFDDSPSFSLSSPVSGETYTIYLTVRDEAGNESGTVSDSIEYNTGSPSVTSFVINSGVHASTSSELNMAISVDSPGATAVDEMKIWLSTDGEPADTAYIAYSSSHTLDLDTDAGKTEGTYTVNIRVRNDAEIESGVTSREVIWDETAPVISGAATLAVDGNTGFFWHNSTIVPLTISGVTDNIDPYEMKIWAGSSESGSYFTYNTSTVFNLTGGDGDYSLHARFRDEAGNESDVLDAATFTLDTTAPGLSLSLDETSPTNTSSIALEPNASDNLSDISNLEMKVWEGTVGSEPADSYYEAYSSSRAYTLSGEGSHTIYVRVRDEAGNSTVDSETITLDTTAPTLAFTLPDGSLTNDNNVSLNLVSDSAATMAVWYDSATIPGGTTFVTFDSSTAITLPSSDDDYTIYAAVRDQAGNQSAIVNRTVTLDTAAPALTAVEINGSDTPDDTNNATLALEITADSSADEMKIWHGSLSDEPADTAYETFAGDTTYELTADGTHTVYVRVRDEAGNESGYVTCSITYDGTAPTASFVINDGEASGDADISLTITPSDLSDADQMKIWVDGTEPDDSEYIAFQSSYTYTLPVSAETEGSHQISIRIMDEVGNTSPSTSVTANRQTVIYDISDPVIGSFTIDESSPTTSETVDLAYSASDAYSSIQVRFSNDGSSYSSWETADGTHEDWDLTSGYGGTTTDETKTVYMQLRDAAGHTVGDSDDIIYDNTAPIANSFTVDDTGAPVANASGTGLFDLILAATGSPDQMKIWDSGTSESAVSYQTYSASASYTLPSGRADGTYTLSVRVYDEAMNPSGILTADVILDREAPELNGFTINGSTSPDDTNVAALNIIIDSTDNLNVYGMKIWTGDESDEPAGDFDSYDSETSYTLSADGDYSVWVRTCDAAGNESDTISHDIRLDTSAPRLDEVYVSDVSNGSEITTTSDGEIFITLDTFRDWDEMKVWYLPYGQTQDEPDDDTYVTRQDNYPITLDSSGTYTIYARIRDNAGNTSDIVGSPAIIYSTE